MTDWQDKITSKFATLTFPKILKGSSPPSKSKPRPRPSLSASAPPSPPKSPEEEKLSFSVACRRSATAPATPMSFAHSLLRTEEYESFHPPSISTSSSSSTTYSSFPTTPHAELASLSSTPPTISVPAPTHSIGHLLINIIEARNLNITEPSRSRPYCLIEFDKNQFTTSDPQRDEVPGGIPIPGAARRPIHRRRDPFEMAKEASCPTWRHEGTFDVTHRDGEITLSVYDRGVISPTDEETFLGMVIIPPNFAHKRCVEAWYPLHGRGDPESEHGTGEVTGEIRIQVTYTATNVHKHLTPSDFRMERLVGRGSFGKVFQVKKIDTGRTYAMKVLNKRDLVERREVTHTLSEKNVLVGAQASPFIVGLKFSFQTVEKLYLVLDFVSGGELFWHLQREKMFSEERAKFYCAELVLALEHLHNNAVVYRDLKPENILLDSVGHVALTDFGLCKEHIGPEDVATTFCGTSEYLAPEVLLSKGYNRAVDWWSLGILLYECMTGWPPFYSEDISELYEKILTAKVRFPPSMSREARDLISALLERDPAKRLGSGPDDAEEIKRHPFFASINWGKLEKKQIRPPFKPPSAAEIAAVGRVGGVGIEDWEDIVGSEGMIVGSNVSQKWREAKKRERENGPVILSETWQEQFGGFSYFRDDASLKSRRTVGSLASVDSWID